MPQEPEVIAKLAPSPVRRGLAIAFTATLGVLCLVLVLLRPPGEPLWIAVLIALGVAALWLARRLALATCTCIDLTEEGLQDGQGRVLAPMSKIVSVERGAFAFKPSNGFLVNLSETGGRAWQPGLWWRFGRRLGVGGVTPGAQGRLMADSLAAVLAERRPVSQGEEPAGARREFPR